MGFTNDFKTQILTMELKKKSHPPRRSVGFSFIKSGDNPNMSDFKSQILTLKKNMTKIERSAIEFNKLHLPGRIEPSFSKSRHNRNGYYGTYIDGESPFIGNPVITSNFNDLVRPRNLTVAAAYSPFHSNRCIILDCNPTKWYQNYLSNLAERATRVDFPFKNINP